MSLNLTTGANALEPVFDKTLRNQLDNTNKLWTIAQKDFDTQSLNGKDIRVKLKTGRNNGIAARAEDQDLADAGQQGYAEAIVPLRFLYATIELTGQALKLIKKGDSAIIDGKASEMEGAITDLTRDYARQLYGDGTGRIAQVNGGGTSTTLVLDNQIAGSTTGMYLNGAKIDIVTALGVVEGSNLLASVTADSATAATLTIPSTTFSDNSWVYIRGNRNNEVVGLYGANDDGTILPVYMNIDCTLAGNGYWKNHTYTDGSPRDLTQALFDQAFYGAVEAGEEPTHAFMPFTPFRTVANTLVTQKQFNVNDERLKKLPGGHRGISLNGIDAIPDVDCNPGVVHVLNDKHIIFYQPEPMGWIDEDGSQFTRFSHRDKFTADLRWFNALFLNRRNVFARLGNVR